MIVTLCIHYDNSVSSDKYQTQLLENQEALVQTVDKSNEALLSTIEELSRIANSLEDIADSLSESSDSEQPVQSMQESENPSQQAQDDVPDTDSATDALPDGSAHYSESESLE